MKHGSFKAAACSKSPISFGVGSKACVTRKRQNIQLVCNGYSFIMVGKLYLVKVERVSASAQVLAVLAGEHATIRAVHLLRQVANMDTVPFGQVELGATLFISIFVL